MATTDQDLVWSNPHLTNQRSVAAAERYLVVALHEKIVVRANIRHPQAPRAESVEALDGQQRHCRDYCRGPEVGPAPHGARAAD